MVGGHRQEKQLAGRLLHRVPQAPLGDHQDPDQRVDHRRPHCQRDHDGDLGQPDGSGQDPHPDPHPEGAVDALREEQLKNEPDDPHEDEVLADDRGPGVELLRLRHRLGRLFDKPVELPAHQLTDHDGRREEHRDEQQQM